METTARPENQKNMLRIGSRPAAAKRAITAAVITETMIEPADGAPRWLTLATAAGKVPPRPRANR